jgi:hypothetical protein
MRGFKLEVRKMREQALEPFAWDELPGAAKCDSVLRNELAAMDAANADPHDGTREPPPPPGRGGKTRMKERGGHGRGGKFVCTRWRITSARTAPSVWWLSSSLPAAALSGIFLSLSSLSKPAAKCYNQPWNRACMNDATTARAASP